MTAHAFSLASKLATLAVGDVIWLNDNDPLRESLTLSATNMERQVTNIVAKSRKLTGRKFRTTRADAITVGREHCVILKVERIT